MRGRSPRGLHSLAGRLEGVERGSVGPVADRVHRHRPARARRAPDHVLELRAARDLDPGAVQQQGGRRAERPIHEALQVPETQHVVAEAGADPERGQLVEPLPRQRLPDAHEQLVVRQQLLVHLERPEPAVLVVQRGHAAARRDAHPLARGLDHLVERGADVAVPERPGGVLAQHSGGLPAGVALDDTARHLERLVRTLKCGAVHPQGVVVPRHQRRRHRAGRAVERGALGRVRPVALAPAEPAQPAARRHARERRLDALERLVTGADALEASLVEPERPGGEVDVRVREAGEDAAAAEIDPTGVRGRPLRHDAAAQRQRVLRR